MRIALDVSALDPEFRAHAIRGTGRYVSELYHGLSQASLNTAEQRDTVSLSSFRYSSLGKGGVLDSIIEYIPAGRTTLRHQLAYPLSITSDITQNADLLHFPVHADAPSWCCHPFIVTVLDLIPLIFKELYAPKKNDLRFRFARWLELQSIKNATLVLAISQSTADDVHRLLGVPYEKIQVTPLGVSDEFFTSSERESHSDEMIQCGIDLERPGILYVGGIDQRKNISFLLECFSDVVNYSRENNQTIPQLIFAGKIKSDNEYKKFQNTIQHLDLTSHIVETGYVSDSFLRFLYKTSRVFFYPSLYEGFGLPPLEALASGLPVACSNTSSLPEVMGDAGEMFDPKNREQAVKALLLLLFESSARDSYIEKGIVQAGKFRWEETIRKTLVGYEMAHKALGISENFVYER